MKKYAGLAAILLALSASAFTTQKIHDVKTADLYWYNPITGAPFSGNPQANPSSNCLNIGTGCAKGFTSPDSDPVNHTAQEERRLN